MSWMPDEYDEVREADSHFKQVELDFDRILEADVGIVCEECKVIMINKAEEATRTAGKCHNCNKPWPKAEQATIIEVPKNVEPIKIRTFETGATRDTDKDKLDWEGFISPPAQRFFVKYMHGHRTQADGTLRDADNWQKGMPRRQYMKSLIRHTWDLWTAWREVWRTDTEDKLVNLLCAIMFNTQGLLHEIAIGRDVDE